jgi:hypothetical protein
MQLDTIERAAIVEAEHVAEMIGAVAMELGLSDSAGLQEYIIRLNNSASATSSSMCIEKVSRIFMKMKLGRSMSRPPTMS